MKNLTEHKLNDKIEDLRFLKMEDTEIYKAMVLEAQKRINERIGK